MKKENIDKIKEADKVDRIKINNLFKEKKNRTNSEIFEEAVEEYFQDTEKKTKPKNIEGIPKEVTFTQRAFILENEVKITEKREKKEGKSAKENNKSLYKGFKKGQKKDYKDFKKRAKQEKKNKPKLQTTDLIKKTKLGKLGVKYGEAYRGYMNAQERIETDKFLKEKLQEFLLKSKDNLFKAVQQSFKSNKRNLAQFGDTICQKLDAFRNNIKNSEYGFHPKSQSLTKDKEGDYDDVIEADAAMIFHADDILNISKDMELSAMSGDDIKPDLLKILDHLKDLEDLFQQRKDYVTGVSQVIEIK